MSDVRWEGFTHQEIYDRVQRGPGGTASAGATAAWRTVEDTLRAVDTQLTEAVRRAGLGWEGVAADGARGGMRVMSSWAVDAADNARLTQNGVAAQGTQADRVRNSMPPPRPAPLLPVAAKGSFTGPVSIGAAEERIAEDRALAVDLMNRYTTTSSGARGLMDYWTAPPTVVVEAVPRGGTGGLGGVGALGAAALVPAAVVGRARDLAAAAAARGAAGARPGPAPATADGRGPGDAGTPGDSAAGGIAGGGGTPGGGVPGGTVVPGGTAGPGARGKPGAGPTDVPGRGAPPGSPVVPGLPGAGAVGPPVTRLPRTDLPTDVRPVVPGPPSRAEAGGSVGSGGGRYPGLPGSPGVIAPPGEVPGRGGWVGVPSTGPPGSEGPVAPGTRGAAEPVAAGRPAAAPGSTGHGAGFLPMGGMPMRSADGDHRRPDYLVDDAAAFADDRWFTPAVIGADSDEGWTP